MDETVPNANLTGAADGFVPMVDRSFGFKVLGFNGSPEIDLGD